MEQISKTQKKQAALALQALGERLVKLKDEQIKSMDLPEDLYKAVALAKTIKKFGPLLRQVQYIGTLMRKYDPQPIQEALQNMERGTHKGSVVHKKVEQWRDQLIAGDDQLIKELAIKFPHADQQHLMDLVQKAREEQLKKNPSPTAARTLFRYLHKTAQQPQIPPAPPSSGD